MNSGREPNLEMPATHARGARSPRWVVWVIAAAGLAILWAAPVSIHLKLFVSVVAIPAAALALMIWWAGTDPRRRRILFISVLLFPVVVLAFEALYAYIAWQEARLTSPLRASIEGLRAGMLRRAPAYNYQLIPSRRYQLWGGTVAIDANGFRSPYDVPRAKRPGTSRVILIGGSSTFGWGVPDGKDIASQLQSVLNRAAGAEKYEVINAAVPYYTSFQEMNWYHNVLAEFAPDVLIVLDGRNDLRNAIMDGARWRPAAEGGIGETPFFTPGSQPAQPPRPLFERALLKSAIYRRIYTFATGPGTPAAAIDSKRPRDGRVDPRCIAQFVGHHQAIAAEAQQRGTGCILALQPVIHVGRQLSADERALSRMWDDTGDDVRHVWPDLGRAVASAPAQGASILDLTDLFASSTEPVYLDECHYTPAGNRIIAERLAIEILKKPPR